MSDRKWELKTFSDEPKTTDPRGVSLGHSPGREAGVWAMPREEKYKHSDPRKIGDWTVPSE